MTGPQCDPVPFEEWVQWHLTPTQRKLIANNAGEGIAEIEIMADWRKIYDESVKLERKKLAEWNRIVGEEA